MKKLFKYFFASLILTLLLSSVASAQIGSPQYWKLQGTTLSPLNSSWAVSIPTLSIGAITMTGDLDLDGNKITFDADKDTYWQSVRDDEINFIIGGGTPVGADGFPSGLFAVSERESTATEIPVAMTIEALPASTNAVNLVTLGNENTVNNWNGIFLINSETSNVNGDQVTFTTDLETINGTRTSRDFVFIQGTSDNKDGLYPVSSVSTTTATVTNLFGGSPSFTNESVSASYFTTKTVNYNGTNGATFEAISGYFQNPSSFVFDAYGTGNNTFLLRGFNTSKTNDLMKLQYDGSGGANGSSLQIDHNGTGKVIEVDADGATGSPLYGLSISLNNTVGAVYNYLEDALGIGDTTPEVGLKVGTAGVSHGQTSINDVGITGTLETNGFIYNDSGVMYMAETTTPTPITNFGALYTKADNNLYFQDGAGAEKQLALGLWTRTGTELEPTTVGDTIKNDMTTNDGLALDIYRSGSGSTTTPLVQLQQDGSLTPESVLRINNNSSQSAAYDIEGNQWNINRLGVYTGGASSSVSVQNGLRFGGGTNDGAIWDKAGSLISLNVELSGGGTRAPIRVDENAFNGIVWILDGTGTYDAQYFGEHWFQNSVTIGNTGVDSSAVLELDSTTKGFLPPRMTNTQMNAIGSPSTGLVVYNTDHNTLYNYDGSSWQSVPTKEEFYPALTASTITGDYRTVSVSANGSDNFNFQVPSDFNNIISLTLIGIVQTGATGAAEDIDITSTYAAMGEAFNTHTGSDLTSTYNVPAANLIWELDISGIYGSLDANDYAGLYIKHNAIGGAINYLGVKLSYN